MSNALTKAHPGTSGRLPVARESKYLRAMVKVATVEDWVEITLRAIEDAKQGDKYAREWLGKYLVGPPEFALQAQLDTVESESGEKIKRLSLMLRNLVTVMEERGDDYGDNDDNDIDSYDDSNDIEGEWSEAE